jgi:hypothetical protein
MSITPPDLTARPLPAFAPDDRESAVVAFADTQARPLARAWRPEPHPRFRPATARVGWRENALWVLAELEDDDIFNAATTLNQRTWETGDAFEIFLRPEGQDTYYEFHVTPENLHLLLRFPNAEATPRIRAAGAAGAEMLKHYLLADVGLRSWTWVEPERGRWTVLAAIDGATLAPAGTIQAGDAWRFSFCRYDYTRGEPEPVTSSTSPHRVADFHDQTAWGRLTFVAE